MNVPRLTTRDSVLLVVDVQDKLLVKMPDAAALVRDVSFMVDVAKLLQVPVMATEQYPKGLGPTNAEIARRLPAQVPSKVTFSCSGAPSLMIDLQASGRRNVVLTGMETHVCIMQTALDLLADEMTVFIPVDAVQARSKVDHETALRRLEKLGVVLTTVEATTFEWMGSAEHPHFKSVSRMIQERMVSMVAGK